MPQPDVRRLGKWRIFAIIVAITFLALLILSTRLPPKGKQPVPPPTSSISASPARGTPTRVVTQPSPAASVERKSSQPAALPRTATATLITVPTPVSPAYYVAADGNDNASGAVSSPWQTISKGISKLQPGDTLYVRAGAYREPLKIRQSGTSSSRITVAAYPGEKPVLEGGDRAGTGDYSYWVAVEGDYVTLDGFEVRNAPANGVGILPASTGAIVRNFDIHHSMNNNLVVSGPYSLVENTKIWQGSLHAAPGYQNHQGYWDGGIITSLTSDVTFRDLEVFNNWGEGVDVLRSERVTVENCTIYDNWALNLYLDNASNVTIQRNLIYFTSDKTWWRYAPDNPSANIAIADERYSSGQNPGHGRQIINNMLIGASSNLHFFPGGAAGSAMINDLIANNTFVEAAGTWASSLNIEPSKGVAHRNTVVQNNIFLQSRGTLVSIPDLTGITLVNNLWSRAPESQYSGTGDVIGDPRLVAPNTPRSTGSVNPDWFKLLPTSPAIGKAAPLSLVTDDYFRQPRPAMPSMGAHEFIP